MRFLAAVLFAMLCVVSVARADQFLDAEAAYDRGDYPTALKLWQPLADQGNAEAQDKAGMMYENGWGVTRDYAEAMKWYGKAAKQGQPDAQWSYAHAKEGKSSSDWRQQHPLKPMDPHSLKVLRESAGHGDCQDQATLGWMYKTDGEVKQDYTEALKWLRKAAERGNGVAQGGLGDMYTRGQGVKQDYVEASFWFGLEQGSEYTIRLDPKVDGYQLAHAKRHLSPEQIAAVEKRIAEWRPKPCTEVVDWYRQLAEQGNALAQDMLGERYQSGDGVKLDNAEALKWYCKAAEQGVWMAQSSLGNIFATKKDWAEAYFWFSVAGDPFAKDYAEKLTSEQKAAVDKRVKEWKQTHPAPLSSQQLDWTVPSSR